MIGKILKQNDIAVSHEMLEKLDIYARLLTKWQKAINLVGGSTLEDMARRHFLDSAQLMKHLPATQGALADMGSGAGFPGMALALLGVPDVHLIESDIRKATFLREVSRETGAGVVIHDKRVESCDIPSLAVVTARAFAPLRDLLGHMESLSGAQPVCGLFLKGAQHGEELEKARKRWDFDLEIFPSLCDTAGVILKIENMARKET